MATQAEVLQARLKEAEEAYHALMTGEKEVSVSTGGRSVTFSQTRAQDLAAYIASLKRQLGTGRAARPIYPIF
ncbi:gpW family head-tail joining protein [Vineibacter terrae]|uniref:gpW family head-tail joining protein n=1 Tax=Vineibacter terrae TaxID=2586908 RepID=UPI002E323F81|nr:gpW family head-tail joining protein [Vineibacter terrae]HEX2888350.1 gpW family head-tail joining protein [Vineibacter terrae]